MKNKTLFVFVLVAVLAGCASGNDDTSDSGIDSGTDTSNWFSMSTGEACSELWAQMTVAKILCTEGVEVSTDFIEGTNQALAVLETLLKDEDFINASETLCAACYRDSTSIVFKSPFCTPRLPKQFFSGDTEACVLTTPKDYVFDDSCRDDIARFIDCNDIDTCCLSAWFVE